MADRREHPNIQYELKVIASNARTAEEYHCLDHQEKCMPNALKENALK